MASKSSSLNSKEALLSGFEVNPTTTCWHDVRGAQLNRKRYHHCSLVLPDGNAVLVVGGYEKGNDSEPLRSAEELDFRTKKWDKTTKLNEKRAEHAAARVGNLLYVFGGRGTDAALDSIECLDLQKDKRKKWVTLDIKLSTPIWGCTAVTVGHLVYIVGGKTNDGTVRDGVDIIDTSMHKLYQGSSLKTPRYGSAGVLLNDHIYVVGGQGPTGDVLSSIEYLRVTDNEVSSPWQTCSFSLGTPRMNFSLTTTSHCLVAIGGKLDDTQCTESMEVVDTKRSIFWPCASLARPLFGCTVECLESNESKRTIVVLGGCSDVKPLGSMQTLQLECASHDNHVAAVETELKEMRSGGGSLRKLLGRNGSKELTKGTSRLKSYLKELKKQGSAKDNTYDSENDSMDDDILRYFKSELPTYDNGRIVAKKELKNSGQARVFKGSMRSEGGKQEVAIKVFKNRQDWMDCKQELMTLLKISGHKNVMGVLDFFEVPMPAFVMRFVSGGDLRDFLDKKGKVTGKKAVNLLVGIGEGLRHLHSNGIVHRDLKSLNILLEGSGSSQRPVLIDLGLGTNIQPGAEGTEFQTRGVMGTAAWMAPEMASSATWSTKTDIFSLGVIMWEILTGKFPFPGKGWDEIVEYTVNKNGRPDSGQMDKAKVPQSHQDLVKTLWHKDPKIRPSADQFLARLQGAN